MPPGRTFRLGLSAASRDSLRLARRVASIGEANMSDLRVARTVRSPFFVAEFLSPSGLPTACMARPFVKRTLRSTCRDFERSRAELSRPSELDPPEASQVRAPAFRPRLFGAEMRREFRDGRNPASPKKTLDGGFPWQMPINNGFRLFQPGAGFCPFTVSFARHRTYICCYLSSCRTGRTTYKHILSKSNW